MERNVQFRQIILVTDGKSNVGINPVKAAEKIHEDGITISTIGIIQGTESEEPMVEIENIARAGGGVSEVTDIRNFSRTMELVTQKSIYKTIEHAVNKELRDILGTDLSNSHPETRKRINNIIDRFGEEATVRCCIVIDCSGSMIRKINVAKNSIINLLRIMKARKGKTEIAVIGFPGINGDSYTVLCNFTEDLTVLEKGMQRVTIGGTTPTGEALEYAGKMLLDQIKSCQSKEGQDVIEEPMLKDSIV